MNTKTMMLAIAIIAAIPAASLAATTITVDSVIQRWPWNNKVDITYTVGGGQDVTNSIFRKIVFTTVIDGTPYTIDGVKDVGASANTGTHTVTWTLPDGVKSTECTMSAAVYEATAPSGDDYMIIDLTKNSDNVTWEGLLATQDDSNDRYNTTEYKTDKLVLRKVPAGGSYRTGANYYQYSTSNSPTNWNTTIDFYVGVFPVTAYQYSKTMGGSPASTENSRKPQINTSWFGLRRPDGDTSNFASTSSIPAVASLSGNFFQCLNYKTGNKFGFDLPTEVMYEIALRAGSANRFYFWSDVDDITDTSYIVCAENSGGVLAVVGSVKPNDWGFYDMGSNVKQLCLDAYIVDNMVSRLDAFTPAWDDAADKRRSRGGTFGTSSDKSAGSSYQFFRASHRTSDAAATGSTSTGFRIAMIRR